MSLLSNSKLTPVQRPGLVYGDCAVERGGDFAERNHVRNPHQTSISSRNGRIWLRVVVVVAWKRRALREAARLRRCFAARVSPLAS